MVSASFSEEFCLKHMTLNKLRGGVIMIHHKTTEKVFAFWKFLTVLLFLSVLFPPPVRATDFDVCSTCTYTTIQSAIDAAGRGDRVRVAQGTYFENLAIWFSKALTISGGWNSDFTTQVKDPSLTIVDANQKDRTLYVWGDSSDITVENFTFQNGKTGSGQFGAGIWVRPRSGMTRFTLRDAIVQDCNTESLGGGIVFLAESSLWANLDNVQVRRNFTKEAGGGISVLSNTDLTGFAAAEVYIRNSVVQGNTAEREAGGVYVFAEEKARTRLVILNSTITGNTSTHTYLAGGGVVVNDDGGTDSTSILEVYNSIIYGNTANLGADLSIDVGGVESRADVYYSDVNGINHVKGTFNQGNNLNADPLFVNPADGDFHLQSNSPLIDAGTALVPKPPGLPAFDVEGDPRSVDSDQDGMDAPDIGADEFIPDIYTFVTLLTPNGGEVLQSGSPYTIQWGGPPEAESFKLLLSMNGGKTWTVMKKGITERSYSWQVPKLAGNRSKCLLKVIGYDASGNRIAADTSAAPSTIEVIKVNSPNGGEVLKSGTTWTIQWETHGTWGPLKGVELFYSTNDGKSWKGVKNGKIKGNNPGHFDWQIPSLKATKTACKVKVELIGDSGRVLGRDTSDFGFEIQP
jgi:hypothetical protein